MTDQAEPGRPPAHDLAAFDISKRAPEQIALSFARWKEQRKRLQQGPALARAGRHPHPKPESAIPRGAARDPERGAAEKPRPIQYSTSFAALLAAGSEPTVAHRIWYPGAELPRSRRPQSTRRRPKVTWVLTGAASVVAVAAMTSGALLEQSEWRSPAGAKPSSAQVHPLDIPTAEPFVATATAAHVAEWNLQQTFDLALMKAAPVAEPVHPPVPVVQRASKAAAVPAGVPAAQPLSEPELQFVPKPFVPSVAPAPATAGSPAVPAAALGVVGDPRPDALAQRGHDKSKGALGASNRAAASGSKPAGAAGSGGSADPRAASSRNSGAASHGASDPASGGTDGDSNGSGAGADAGGDAGGGSGDAGSSDSGGDTGGDTGGSGGGDAGGESEGDDNGGDAGGGEAGGSDTDGASGGDGDSGGGNGNGGAENKDKNKDKSD